MASILFMMPCFAQNVAINEDGSLPHPRAILDIKSETKGILIPRISTAARMSIVAPQGLLVYDINTFSFWYSQGWYLNATLDTVTLWKNMSADNNWSLTGNTVFDNNSFLGTIGNSPFNIRVNSLASGRIDPLLFNTYWGYESGVGSTITTNATGNGNTASGYRSLYSNINGNSNTATGMNTLKMNTSGQSNTASGAYALAGNTTGSNNTANGIASLYKNTTGSYNTAIGYNTLSENISGSMNTAIGVLATVSSSFLTNATAIGYGATVNASNKIRLGNSNVTVIEGQVPFTVPSDGRFKFQVKEDVKGLDFILQLRPVTYQFDVKRFDAQYSQTVAGNENSSGNYALQAVYDEATNLRRSGFIAQEVEKAAIASGYNFSGIIQPKSAQEHYSLSYEAFVVPLVKAVQEQQQAITAQNKIIAELQQQLKEIKQLLQASK
jgi:trimeric autotransporter adhesin